MAGPARAFKEARWLSGVKPLIHNQAQIKGTVEEVGGHKSKDGAALLINKGSFLTILIEFFTHSARFLKRVCMGIRCKCKFILSRQVSVIACDVDWQVCGACQHFVDEDSLKPPHATVTQDQLHRSCMYQLIFVC